MSEHARFHFDTLNALKAKLDDLGVSLPFDDNFDQLYEPLTVGNQKLPNRFAVQPMEGFDADPTGTPQDLSFRRYKRYAAGGSALIWFEATAMTPNSRSNPHQFHLNPENVAVFKKLVEETRRTGREANGFEPTLILQLTHSGRYSKPTGAPAPIIAHHSPILDPKHNLPADYPLITDDELDELQEKYLLGAQLAFEAGFDGIDIKACHRYLVSELLASFTRENSRYGGSFENRTRFLREVAAKIHNKFPEKLISTRMNVFDAISHPYGWGVSEEDYHIPNLEEPKKLIGQLRDAGMKIINISIGNPYFNPHFGRPYDHPIRGIKPPEEHPLRGLARFVDITRDIQQTYPDLPIIGSGYTWLRHFMPYAAAGTLKTGGATLIGQGRGMFAYPNSVNELRKNGKLDPHKVCITCSACTQIMRDGAYTGCVIRDSEIYAPIYRKYTKMAKDSLKLEAERCRDCFTPTCQEKCPAGINIPKFIKAYADGDIKTAYETLTEKNLLPEICAYVCPAEEQCQAGCVEKLFTGKSVRIRDIQKAVAEEARKMGIAKISFPEKVSGKRIAIVGAGSAGLTCAASLIQKGHAVTIYDARTLPGGIVRSVLPEGRIDFDNVDNEIQSLLGNVPADRLEWKLGSPLTKEFNLDQLKAKYDAVFLGMGLTEGIKLFNDAPQNVVEALDFLREAKSNDNFIVPGQVAVIGGGNTAMDAAVAAQLAGAQDVYLLYRRSFAELPAWPAERDAALNAGIHFLILSQPVEYVANELNDVKAVKIARTKLGEPDESGRRRPEILGGNESVLPVNLVIEAIGQRTPNNMKSILNGIELNRKGLVVTAKDSNTTSVEGVYAGGDLINGGATAVQAVADGLRASNEIDTFLE